MKYIFILLMACLSAPAASLTAQTPSANFPFDVPLTKPDGTVVSSADVLGPADGRPTVIAFWLTTCQPCHYELAAYAKEYADRQAEKPFRLVAISIDFPEKFAQFQEYARTKNYPFPVYWDATRAFKELIPGRLNGLPQVFVYDAAGQLLWQHKGYLPGAEKELWEAIR
ncbi:MAG: TlpA family protein disulfide reductase [Saprospiraceae bacterium]